MTRQKAKKELLRLFGFMQFYDLQWEVIENLFAGKRMLFIEKTGFVKSLCYQFPATLLDGVTIVFSPLIALMRDQVRSMQEKGIGVQVTLFCSEDINSEVSLPHLLHPKLIIALLFQ
jgi:ATP-dependent DNA helicase RecQ